MSTDCHSVTKRKLAAGFGDFGAVASGWWPPQGRHGRGSRRPALAWAGPLGKARRPSAAAERLTLNGANHRSALPVAASGYPSQVARARLDGSARPHRIPGLHCPGLSSHARIASRTCGGCQRLGFGRLRLLRGCSSHKAGWCVPDAPADSTQPALTQAHRLALRRPA
jgi:hypothetical protein